MSIFRITTLALLGLGIVACTKGGGGHDAPFPVQPAKFPADVPDGAGLTQIDMSGIWEVRNLKVIGGTVIMPELPDLIEIRMDATHLMEINGNSVSEKRIGGIAGVPLDWYINSVDGKTLIFGYKCNRIEVGGLDEVFGLAAGALSGGEIYAEAYLSGTPRYGAMAWARARFMLVKRSGSSAGTSFPEVQGLKPTADPAWKCLSIRATEPQATQD